MGQVIALPVSNRSTASRNTTLSVILTPLVLKKNIYLNVTDDFLSIETPEKIQLEP